MIRLIHGPYVGIKAGNYLGKFLDGRLTHFDGELTIAGFDLGFTQFQHVCPDLQEIRGCGGDIECGFRGSIDVGAGGAAACDSQHIPIQCACLFQFLGYFLECCPVGISADDRILKFVLSNLLVVR